MQIDLEEKNISSQVCPVCNGQSDFSFKKNNYYIFKCFTCNFLHVFPYPTKQEVIKYYSSGYRTAHANFYPKLKSRKRRANLKALNFLQFIYHKKTIDIGCGGGIMADAFRRLGAKSYGIDISQNSIDFARNNFPKCTFFCETFDEAIKRKISFDFIFTTELMEHLTGPHECMRFINAVSRPETIVYVATPDTDHKKVPKDISSWSDICPPEHLQWFNKSNMEKLFNQYGFYLLKPYNKKSPALSMLFKKSRSLLNS